MKNTNLELSKNESELITNSDVILTKNRIIEKVYALFGLLSEEYRKILNEHTGNLPVEIFNKPPKIYKGEQYLGLPYVMMDYPRCFFKNDVFAIRSFFWWGNYFSITLQLSGQYLEMFAANIIKHLKSSSIEDYFLGVNDSAWEHHFEKDNYVLLKDYTAELVAKNFMNKPFIKIAKKLSLSEWNNAMEFYKKTYEELLGLMAAQ
jgi:hypothetical protein